MAANVGQRHLGEREQLLGAFDPSRGQPLMARDTEARLEGAREVADRELALAGEIRKPNRPVEVLAQELGGPPSLPRSEATRGWAALLSQACVLLHHMSSDDQLELVEGEECRSSAPAEEGLDASRYLREHDVLLVDGASKLT